MISVPTRINSILSSRTHELYEYLGNKYTINETERSGGWKSFVNYEFGRITICYDPSDFREECLAHELLHLRLEDEGFRPPLCHTQDAELYDHFYNYFSDSIIYPQFCRLGFDGGSFPRLNDVESIREVLEDIEILENYPRESPIPRKLLSTILSYILAPSPGNAINQTALVRCRVIDKDLVDMFQNTLASLIEGEPRRESTHYINQVLDV